MKPIDRVMRAYTRTRNLTDDQHRQVRGELAKFIEELLLGKNPPAGELQNNENAPIGKADRHFSRAVDD